MSAVAVRELVEFTAKRGDLDLRFTPAPSAQEGIAGHGVVARRRGAGYERELPLGGHYAELELRGRADGLRQAPLTLEEIKTHRGDLRQQKQNHRDLHWAQLKIYGALLCAERGLEELQLSLVYFDVDRQEETVFTETHTQAALQQHYREHAETYLSWHREQQTHRDRRDAALAALRFPHADFHAGQRQLSEAVYRAAARGQVLLAQAPTGIGKSIGTLFPALKALAAQRLDKVFFLTAKTSGRQAALEALEQMRPPNGALPLRVLELTARDKACVHPDKACHGESCPLARGFYDRLPAARAEATEGMDARQGALREVAARHQVCPYYLAQDLVRWSDVVVGDYNYWFDQSALLHGLTALNQWKVVVLADEAHNLVERGRAMYSAELSQPALRALRPLAPPAVKRTLTRVSTAWNRHNAARAEDVQYQDELPAALVETLRQLSVEMGSHLAREPLNGGADLQRAWFDVLAFAALAESFGTHSLFETQILGGGAKPSSAIAIRNVVPAPFLTPRTATAAASVLFSATLHPPHYYRDLLGLPETTRELSVASPFHADQLEVRLVAGISTRYQRRAASLAPIAALVAAQYRQRPGNYLAFFSSFDYLEQVAAVLQCEHADVPLWPQARRMSEPERAQFLAQFTPQGQGVGLAVLGGVFAEGIDLPGDRLIGAFIATLGLPQVNAFNEQLMRRLGQRFGKDAAYDYAYLYPGLQKVVQAAGRVVRSRTDQGVLCLIDDRYAQGRVRALLPSWWAPRVL